MGRDDGSQYIGFFTFAKNKALKNNQTMIKIFKKHKLKIILAAIIFLAIVGLGYKSFFRANNFEVKNAAGGVPKNSAAKERSAPAEKCANEKQRAIAVMLATDKVTRPLSGISQADMVFEMPVITDSITRLMVVYGCSFPEEIGSVRSARHDFIGLALGIDAIYTHWGGSHFAQDKLKTGVIDELDALVNPYNVFYRKSGIPAPHNGFTSGELLLNTSKKLGYRLENKFEGYPREKAEDIKPKTESNGFKLIVGYPGEFRIEYQYDARLNSYLRSRGGKKEIDRNNGKQAAAKNIAVMYAETKQIEGQYNDVKLEGQGKAEFYFDGGKIDGIWEKINESSKLYFLDNSGAEIKFTPGNIWVEILQTNQKIEWSNQ